MKTINLILKNKNTIIKNFLLLFLILILFNFTNIVFGQSNGNNNENKDGFNLGLKKEYLQTFEKFKNYDEKKIRELQKSKKQKFNFTGKDEKIDFWSEEYEQKYYNNLIQRQTKVRNKLEEIKYNNQNDTNIPESYKKILNMKQKIESTNNHYYFAIKLNNTETISFNGIGKHIVLKPFLLKDKEQNFSIITNQIDSIISNYEITEKQRFKNIKDFLENHNIKFYVFDNYFKNTENNNIGLKIGELGRVKMPIKNVNIFNTQFFIPKELKKQLNDFNQKEDFVLYTVLTKEKIDDFMLTVQGEEFNFNYLQSFFQLPEQTFLLQKQNKKFLELESGGVYKNEVNTKYNYTILKNNQNIIILIVGTLLFGIFFSYILFRNYYNVVFKEKVQTLSE